LEKKHPKNFGSAVLICMRVALNTHERKALLLPARSLNGGVSDDSLILIDEVLTPDSSRFWPLDSYREGQAQPSSDKQFVRDWLSETDWDKDSPPPALPDEIVQQTRAKYIEAYEIITGESFAWK
jgi:phosphoribosylaminoimidazole-succinocarboxamide synthase